MTIRFRHGLYDYLTVIECRRRKGAVKADHVEAFVTKARDANADRAIFASTSSYQSGAVEVAKRHRISLIHVRENLDRLEAVLGEPEEVVHVRAIALIYSDGEHIELPDDSDALEYYAHNIRIGFSNVSKSLNSILKFHLDRLPLRAKDDFEVVGLPLPTGAKILSPTDDDNVRLDEMTLLQVQYGITDRRPIKSDSHFQQFLLSPDIDLEDITTGERWTFGRFGLPVGIGTEFHEGVYYKNVSLGFFYYCESTCEDIATMWLVESFQGGRLIQAILRSRQNTAKTMRRLKTRKRSFDWRAGLRSCGPQNKPQQA